MHFQQIQEQLQANMKRIETLVEGVSPKQARMKPDANSWSILEVINHLYDEEREDFRARLDILLHHPDQDWHPIDPGIWVTERQYNKKRLDESLAAFIRERKYSVGWLEGLKNPDWDTSREASFGTIRAGDLLAAWVAHDFLHMRQLVELQYFSAIQLAKPYNTNYAGPW
jgi:hypothetical protein